MNGDTPVAARATKRPELRVRMREPAFLVSVIPLSLLHLAISIRGMLEPVRVVIGDRALGRLERARLLVRGDDPLGQLLNAGWPGDYGFHALALGLGGLPLVLMVQLGLFVATLVMLYLLARRADAPGWAAALAVAAFGLLASNLHQPHTIVTEALFNPAVAGFVLTTDTILRERLPSARNTVVLGCLAALAIALRPVFLPVLPALSVFLAWKRRAGRASLVLANALAMAPLVAWGGVQIAHDQPVALGGEGFSLEHNLHGRMERMRALGADAIPPGLGGQAGVVDYAVYSVANPGPFARAMATDALMLVVNPGVNHTFGVFFGFFDKSEGTQYWVPLIDQAGVWAALSELARRDGVRLLWNAAGLAFWAAFCAVAGLGAVAMFDGARRDLALALGLTIAVLAAATFTSHAVRWSQRSPMEFSLAVWFAVGLPEVAPLVRRARAGLRSSLGRARPS